MFSRTNRRFFKLFLLLSLVITTTAIARWGLFKPFAIVEADPGRLLAFVGIMIAHVVMVILYRIARRMESAPMPPIQSRPRDIDPDLEPDLDLAAIIDQIRVAEGR